MSSLLVQAKGNFQNTRGMGSQHPWAYLPRPRFLDMLLLCATRHIEGYLRHFYPAINLAEAFHSWNCKGRSHLYNVPELCAGKLGWFCIVLPHFDTVDIFDILEEDHTLMIFNFLVWPFSLLNFRTVAKLLQIEKGHWMLFAEVTRSLAWDALIWNNLFIQGALLQ